MAGHSDPRLDAIAAVMPPLLAALATLERVGRYLHPPNLHALVESTKEAPQAVSEGLAVFEAMDWPEDLGRFHDSVAEAAGHVLDAFAGLAEAPRDPNGPIKAYRAMRSNIRALEALYRIAPEFPPVSDFFLEPTLRGRLGPAASLRAANPTPPATGVLHFANDRESRGGYSVYVPEYYSEARAHPLIMALHGGSGHGADFLWTWLREARSHGAIVVSPTSQGRTWSLMGADFDTPRLHEILESVAGRWNVDRTKLLLTGMSDGATFSYLSGLLDGSPFTHLAPSSASFHTTLVDGASPERLRGLPVYIMHGELDWMFPVDFAHIASAALTRAGAKVILRAIPDLSHTYPRDENPKIMRWFLGES
ncbi:MAG: phospholipase [Dehalococcoidia bacterium]